MKIQLAKRMQKIKASEIRELLKLTQHPEMISFAGGLPAPETFPVEDFKKVADTVLHDQGRRALQYSTTDGDQQLREAIAQRSFALRGLNFGIDFRGGTTIRTESTQALDVGVSGSTHRRRWHDSAGT